MSRIILREFHPDQDTGLILSTFAKSVYHGGYLVPVGHKRDWFESFHQYAMALLEDAELYIACSEYDLNHIVGYSIVDGGRLEFVYVKEGYRNQGIGTLLTQDKYQRINANNLTNAGAAILKSHRYEEDEHGEEND